MKYRLALPLLALCLVSVFALAPVSSHAATSQFQLVPTYATFKATGYSGTLFPSLYCTSATLVSGGKTYYGKISYNPLLNTCDATFTSVKTSVPSIAATVRIAGYTTWGWGGRTYIGVQKTLACVSPTVSWFRGDCGWLKMTK